MASSSRGPSSPKAQDLALLTQAGDELVPVLLNRNYVLTLVRAGTVLDKEDLQQPKGEALRERSLSAAFLSNSIAALQA